MDIERLLRSLKDHKVKYVVVGAAAFPIHGYARATLDFDIFIEPSKTNANRCLAALKGFGYDLTDVTVKDLLNKKLLIRQYLLEVDVHPFVKGVRFENVWKNRLKGKIGKTDTYIASLDDMIKMKRAAGRPKDREDLKILMELKLRKKNGK